VKRAVSFVAVVAAGGITVVVHQLWPRSITEESLVAQLAGSHCRFVYEVDHCEQRGIDPLRSLFIEQHDCDLWAVKCLADLKTKTAVEALKQVLETKTDIQTCDGIRPIRSLAVKYLGESGDPTAIEPLQKLLASNPVQTLSPGAAGCDPGPEDLDSISTAIEKLQ
jgi:hypothetical protein